MPGAKVMLNGEIFDSLFWHTVPDAAHTLTQRALAPLMVQQGHPRHFRTAHKHSVVEQNAKLALQAARHGYVMESKMISLSGPAAVVSQGDRNTILTSQTKSISCNRRC
jgi:hypothetical protein